MHENVIQFPKASTRRAPRLPAPPADPDSVMQDIEIDIKNRLDIRAQIIAHNEDLRAQRREAWKKAANRSCFFEAWENWCLALYIGQRAGIDEALKLEEMTLDGAIRMYALRKSREADAEQLLTPSPDRAALIWKQCQIRLGWLSEQQIAQVERSIADDEAFLSAHPARQCRHTPKA